MRGCGGVHGDGGNGADGAHGIRKEVSGVRGY